VLVASDHLAQHQQNDRTEGSGMLRYNQKAALPSAWFTGLGLQFETSPPPADYYVLDRGHRVMLGPDLPSQVPAT